MATKFLYPDLLEGVITGYMDVIHFTEDGEEITGENYFSMDAVAKIKSDCDKALHHAMENCKDFWFDKQNIQALGHDLWLTRNRHGAGFWDGDWREDMGKIMTEYSHKIGEQYAYIGDSGNIELQ